MIINYNSELFKIGDEIQIFGDDFVENNRDKFKLIINNEYSDLKSTTIIKDKYLEIILVQKSKTIIQDFNNVENINFMFNGCTEIKKLDLTLFGSFENVINMDSVFSECNNLIEIKGIELWNTVKVKIMASMFNGCEKFERINGIENFNTQNVIDFSEMFCNCQGLVIIQEIEK